MVVEVELSIILPRQEQETSIDKTSNPSPPPPQSYSPSTSTSSVSSSIETASTGSNPCDQNITNGEVVPILKTQAEQKKHDENFKKRALGIGIVVAIAILMTGIGELNQHILSNGYNQPLVLVLFNTLFLSLAIPIEIGVLLFHRRKARKSMATNTIGNINSSVEEIERERVMGEGSMIAIYKSEFLSGLTKMTVRSFFLMTFLMCVLYVSLNWIWSKGLPLTEVSTSNAIFQSATVWVFFFSIFILKDKVTILKIVYVLFFVGGVIGISIADHQTNGSSSKYPNPLLGDILMIVSSIMWALYEVLTTKFTGDCKRTVVNTFIGGIGLFSVLIGIPMLLAVHYSGFERFVLPDQRTFLLILGSNLLAFVLNYLINWGLSVTSPLHVRSGELMTIPFTLIFDIVFKHMTFYPIAIPGFSLIIIGFVLSLYVENKHMKEKLAKEAEQAKEKEQQQDRQQQQDQEYNKTV
ncbi:hypothetical protein DFA_12088 [Cavenderia fasciculata]|uniref:EamA domain-containing protein n=1 Tax=Cavenderia fasciculata TaxID=261658 RepID=F4QFS1_CACFS|nr:uncharacterized protein DFA_12088 [Cavenderia fasciculata]EGG14318.1 hypothetical protein DFA_12088 [Cavenderia fasciculata]|eukprot:XP_004351027.1 hypothetical protein DFA_12088 [Cavenderia fasciculata]